jgi:hypothetical protein
MASHIRSTFREQYSGHGTGRCPRYLTSDLKNVYMKGFFIPGRVAWMLAFMIVATSLKAQVGGEAIKIIELDSITTAAKEVIPTDVPFVLKLQSNRTYTRAILNQVSYLYPGLRGWRLANKHIETIPITSSGKLFYFNVSPIPTQHTYDLYLLRNPFGSEWATILQTNQDIFLASAAAPATFGTIPQYTEYPILAATGVVPVLEFPAYQAFFTANLQPLYAANSTFINPTTVAPYTFPTWNNLIANPDLDIVLDSAIRMEASSVSLAIQKLNGLTAPFLDDVLLGLTPLDSKYFSVASPTSPPRASLLLDFNRRVGNLGKSLAALKEIYNFVELLNESYTPAVGRYNMLVSQLTATITSFEANQRALNAIMTQVTNSGLLFADEYSSSSQSSFSSGVAQVVQADVGVALLYTNKKPEYGNYIRPYFGVNFNVRPVNKNVPFNNIPGFWKRLSFMAGITVGSLARGNEPVKDLFASNNLLLGAGIRANHAIRFNAGTLLFNAENNNPLIDRKELKFGAFYSVSIDMEIRNLLSSIAGLLNI